MNIEQFIMEDVRCFSDRQTLEIRPLTFLVGENSTGKTTVLSCFHVLANYFIERRIDFNTYPYSMGTFKDIIRNSKKPEKTFKLGFMYKYENEEIVLTVVFAERSRGIEPIVSSISLQLNDGIVTFTVDDSTEVSVVLSSYDEEQNHFEFKTSIEILNNYPLFLLFSSLERRYDEDIESLSDKEKVFRNFWNEKNNKDRRREFYPFYALENMSIFSTSPVRSRPKRTYDPTREFNDPEGSDVPMYLMRVEATEKKDWEKLKKQLVDFGTKSKLFQNLQIKKLGRSLGAPFQLQFKVRGPSSNIIDVGYGISQILPLLVQVLNPSISHRTRETMRSNFTLLQQPEVHLHPRAQAEFSSLLANLANEGNQSFIVETHSDYMIDRARIEIRKENIKPSDVSLIYFEPYKNIVRMHNIGFDKMGNLINVPKHYRDFFLLESDRLMGFED